jgi:hypothetical protein
MYSDIIKKLLSLEEAAPTVVAMIGTDGLVLHSDSDDAMVGPTQDIVTKIQGAASKSMDSDIDAMPFQTNIKIDPTVMSASCEKVKEILHSHSIPFDWTDTDVIASIEDPMVAYTDGSMGEGVKRLQPSK